MAAGKASRSLAQHIPGPGSMEGMKGAASGVVGELARARIALDERGQKLGELEERTAAMMASADSFSKHAHDVSSLLAWACDNRMMQWIFDLWDFDDDDDLRQRSFIVFCLLGDVEVQG